MNGKWKHGLSVFRVLPYGILTLSVISSRWNRFNPEIALLQPPISLGERLLLIKFTVITLFKGKKSKYCLYAMVDYANDNWLDWEQRESCVDKPLICCVKGHPAVGISKTTICTMFLFVFNTRQEPLSGIASRGVLHMQGQTNQFKTHLITCLDVLCRMSFDYRQLLKRCPSTESGRHDIRRCQFLLMGSVVKLSTSLYLHWITCWPWSLLVTMQSFYSNCVISIFSGHVS